MGYCITMDINVNIKPPLVKDGAIWRWLFDGTTMVEKEASIDF